GNSTRLDPVDEATPGGRRGTGVRWSKIGPRLRDGQWASSLDGPPYHRGSVPFQLLRHRTRWACAQIEFLELDVPFAPGTGSGVRNTEVAQTGQTKVECVRWAPPRSAARGRGNESAGGERRVRVET